MTYIHQILADISKATTPDEFRKLIIEAKKHKDPDDGLILTLNDKSIAFSKGLCDDNRVLEWAINLIWQEASTGKKAKA